MAAGYTQIRYNGVEIRHCHTRQFRQEAVFDPADNNLSHYKYTVRVAGLLDGTTSSSHFQSIGAFTQTGEPSGTYRELRVALGTPRGSFEMRTGVVPGTSNGVVILQAEPYDQNSPLQDRIRDVCNGPKCRVVELVHIAANQCFRVECEFEINLRECTETNAKSPGVLWNVWDVVDDVDQNLWTTRTYTGTLRTVSGMLNANSFRGLVVPHIQPGLRREAMNFAVAKDGLTLAYTIVDREVMYQPPRPARNWHFKHTEATKDGLQMDTHISIMMEGDRNTPRRNLIELCMAFAAQKIEAGVLAPGVGLPAPIYDFFSIAEESGSSSTNRVYLEVNARNPIAAEDGQENIVDKVFRGLKLRFSSKVDTFSWLGKDPNYNADVHYDSDSPLLEGPMSRWGAFVSYLQCPCCEDHAIGDVRPTQLGSQTTSTPNPTSISSVEVEQIEIPPKPAYLSNDHQQAMYTFWKCDSTYTTISGRKAMPVARSASTGTSEDQNNSPSVKIIRLHPDICTRTLRLSGERVGQRPKVAVPDVITEENGITQTLLDKIVKPSTSSRTPDGKELFRVDVEYRFALSRAPREDEELSVGENPWDTLGVQKMKLTEAMSSVLVLPDGQS